MIFLTTLCFDLHRRNLAVASSAQLTNVNSSSLLHSVKSSNQVTTDKMVILNTVNKCIKETNHNKLTVPKEDNKADVTDDADFDKLLSVIPHLEKETPSKPSPTSTPFKTSYL